MMTVRSAAPAPRPPLPGRPGRAPPGQGLCQGTSYRPRASARITTMLGGGRREQQEGGERAGAGPYYNGAQMRRVLGFKEILSLYGKCMITQVRVQCYLGGAIVP